MGLKQLWGKIREVILPSSTCWPSTQSLIAILSQQTGFDMENKGFKIKEKEQQIANLQLTPQQGKCTYKNSKYLLKWKLKEISP